MRLLLLVAVALQCAVQAHAKAVFAHFMVGNTGEYTSADWLDDIKLAQEAHIDAFAMNMAYGAPMNGPSLEMAFAAASSRGFQLMFSFDYAGNGSWPKQTVIDYLTRWGSSGAYFKHNGQPLVSTFEGPESSDDWIEIKARTGCFFIPDWSSDGAKKAMERSNGVADGLFSWDAWPWGDREMNTYSDASYAQYLNGKPYMMPVSPWFYTNMPGFDKNWLWRGDMIWPTRWFQAEWWGAEFLQIISWNDYGESHHIGPIREKAMEAFDRGQSPFNYALPHDAWRELLPFYIDRYKTGTATITKEGIVAWWRPQPHGACDDGNTVGNTASQLQREFLPAFIMDDHIFYTALLKSAPDLVEVMIGGKVNHGGFFTHRPEGDGPGMYAGSVSLEGRTGEVYIRMMRDGKVIAGMTGKVPISRDCDRGGYQNYDAYVQSTWVPITPSVPTPNTKDLVCVNGTGVNDFEILCQVTCSMGYCPKTSCVCTKLGKQPTLPKSTGVIGYPAEGRDASYDGLCKFACDLGKCDFFKKKGVCDDKPHPLIIPDVSPFLPLYCTGGVGDKFHELCVFSCKHGFCPMRVCQCTDVGHLDLLEPTVKANASSYAKDDYGLCNFACSRGFCPDTSCHEDGITPEQDGYGDDYGYNAELDMYFSDLPEEWTCSDALDKGSVEDVLKAVEDGSMPSSCRLLVTLQALRTELENFDAEFRAASEGYDDLFGYYEDYIKDMIDPQLQNWMSFSLGDPNKDEEKMRGAGNKYFTCSYRRDGKALTTDCPPPKEVWNDKEQAYTIKYTVRSENKLKEALDADLGIAWSWIKFDTDTTRKSCISTGMEAGEVRTGVGSRACRQITQKREGFPMRDHNAKVEVGNPKKMIEAAMPNITALGEGLYAQYFDQASGAAEAQIEDVVTAASVPIFMLQNALESMKEIKRIGAKEREEKKKSLILLILSIVLMVVPFVGEAFGAVFGGATMITRVALIISEVGNAALTVVDIVKDPLSAPFAILGMVTGSFGGVKSGQTNKSVMKDAADVRRALKDVDLKKFGKGFTVRDARIQKIIGACVRK
ncbi:Mutanase [Podospora australis]|uniref:Mutanase n=1 Tax=Podospora australis TaxID=1536484 RepID=A0AAN6WL17_9PEZI|nr:Mutanase [Podospora australis]